MKPAGAPTPTRTPTPASTAAFGPVDGSLSDDDGAATFRSDVNLADFVAEVTFVGDLPTVWIPVRIGAGFENWHAVSLDELNGSVFAWQHRRRLDGADPERIQIGGVSSYLATGANARNHVRVIAYGDVGLLFINGAFEAELDFSGATDAGDVSLVAYGERDEATSERNPVSVRFENFSVRPLSAVYGPESGTVEHEDDGIINSFASLTSIADGVIEATFSNPYPTRDGSWSAGFLFRENDGFHAVIFDSGGRWYHELSIGSNPARTLAEGVSARVSDSEGAANRIRIAAIGEDGWLFINGEFTSKLDLSGGAGFGETFAIANYFVGEGIPGKLTRFADFTIHAVER